jgi:hypothetical protein
VDADKYKSFFSIDYSKTPIKLSLLSLKDSDAGDYEMKLKVTLKDYKDVPAVLVPITVKVLPCTPLTLLPKSKPKTIALKMKEGEEGEMVTQLPLYEQKPSCGLKVDYTVKGTKTWLTYDNKEHKVSIARKSAINGKYEMSV